MRCLRTSVRVLSIFMPLVLALGEAASPEAVIATRAQSASPTIVLGFVGGFVSHNNRIHSTVQVVERLRTEYPAGTYVRAFENRRRGQAFKQILRQLDVNHDGVLSSGEKQNARIILFGHSWGASETVALARKLDTIGIPVLLTIQVDSIAKIGQNDQIIPPNVKEAVNFFQPNGLLHGRRQIRAADPERTQILGNYRIDYKANPLSCASYPWFNRIFIKPHTQIECDPKVWSQVEALIDSRLSAPVPYTASR
jgi:pimeloyl-ACP methyl ester carboxylesterase